MELKNFIVGTISAIADATSELQASYESQGVIINPPSAQSGSDVFQPGSTNYTMRRVQKVVFDVAITAGTSTSGAGGGGIKVWSAEIGGRAEHSVNDEKVSRVQFEIPITLKPSRYEEEHLRLRDEDEVRTNSLMKRGGRQVA